MNTYPSLVPRQTRNAVVIADDGKSWHLAVLSGPKTAYRLAQLDDYMALPRSSFPWYPPLTMSLRARVSAGSVIGTWGFGLWNDPFGFALGVGGTTRRFPTLPNAAWFFYASPSNYLSFHDDLPAQGFLAATFKSPRWGACALTPGLLGLPLLLIHPIARWIRRQLTRIICQDAVTIDLDVMQWHKYRLDWDRSRVLFNVDDVLLLETDVSPNPPLGLVLWIDNQFAAFTPDGRIGYGLLECPNTSFLELTNIMITR